jgi:translation elongation factor EF-1alpha
VNFDSFPLRIVVTNIIKFSASLLNISAKIEAGYIETTEQLFIMPDATPVIVKGIVSLLNFEF